MEKYLKEAYDASKDEEVIGLYDLEELNREKMAYIERTGFENGEQVGYKNGVKETTINIAKKLLKENFNIEKIIELTDLTGEQIESLR